MVPRSQIPVRNPLSNTDRPAITRKQKLVNAQKGSGSVQTLKRQVWTVIINS